MPRPLRGFGIARADCAKRESAPHRYRAVAGEIARLIDTGTLRPNERVPSLRELSRLQKVSLATALLAYRTLEDEGLIRPRAGSGFYVADRRSAARPRSRATPAPASGATAVEAIAGSTDQWPASLGAHALDGPAAHLLPGPRLSRIIANVVRRHPSLITQSSPVLGGDELRRQIARRTLELGCSLQEDEIIVTSGGSEALALALRAVVSAGDAVAVESPCDPATLQLLQQLALRPIEIRADPGRGICPDVLSRTLEQAPIKACLFMLNCSSPLGYVMPDEQKRCIVELLERRNIPLIENEALGDLAHGSRPVIGRAFARGAGTIVCYSFTKTLSPGLRLGWIAPGRYAPQVRRQKRASALGPSLLLQLAAAEYLRGSAFDRHLRALRRTLGRQAECLLSLVQHSFPRGSRPVPPAGGYGMWIELPRAVRAEDLDRFAGAAALGLLHGSAFSIAGRYGDSIRVGCGRPWTAPAVQLLHSLGAHLRGLIQDGRMGD